MTDLMDKSDAIKRLDEIKAATPLSEQGWQFDMAFLAILVLIDIADWLRVIYADIPTK